MPHIPHEYTVRIDYRPTTADDTDFVDAVNFIRDNGIPERYYSKTHIYFYIGGRKYWTMGAPVENTWIINRAFI